MTIRTSGVFWDPQPMFTTVQRKQQKSCHLARMIRGQASMRRDSQLIIRGILQSSPADIHPLIFIRITTNNCQSRSAEVVSLDRGIRV